ncbi:DUF3466 family protein [Colwellia sp. D2M02]|uniref:DUF3466 family protein n=1 Tax=Colwellia sp. D2M02 TaxID=2841562 RepID=UPI001C09D096|nr:DUF3466 family protein [Colwellia sp. D2M02]MBU2893473.1 DUF3466 family protein [Colwellia sp. D2M02]
MKQFAKHMLAVGITSALSFSVINPVAAATYKVVDKIAVDELKHSYAQQQNNNGVLAISGSNLYNFPVQFDYLDDDDFTKIRELARIRHERVHGLNEIENYDELVAGNPTANDLAWVKSYLALQVDFESPENDPYEYQRVGDLVAMINLGGDADTEVFKIFDQPFAGTDTLTRSTIDIISGVTNSGIAYGSATAPYLPMEDFTTSNGNVKTFWLREHGQRGFFSYDNGAQIFPVIPAETRYGGGISAVLDVNDNGEAVGYMSYELSETIQEYVEDESNGCSDPDVVDDFPFEICVQRYQPYMYRIMAFKGSLNANGEVTSEQLGLLVEPHPEDTRNYSSRALAINNNGVAVGFADGWDDEGVTTPDEDERLTGSYAVMFKDGKVFDFNQEHYSFRVFSGSVVNWSKAYDINDHGLVVGTTNTLSAVNKFFYVDTSVPEAEMKMTLPDDFFKSSQSAAYAVNNNGMIVGDGEIETHNASTDNPRRTAAFLYDSKTDVFNNVNDLLECGSPYTVVEARDINDENVISGTAIIKVDRYDAKGELMLDSDGSPLTEDVVRAVTLVPIAGEVEDCFDEEEKVERQGASFNLLALLSLFGLFGVRLYKRIF